MNNRKQQPNKQKPQNHAEQQQQAPGAAATKPEALTVTLSPEASALVRWYCVITHHFADAAVEGAVFGTLERAKEAYEGPEGGDEAFNWLLDDVSRAMHHDDRAPVCDTGRRLSLQLDEQASAAVRQYTLHTGADPRDVANAAILAEVPHVVEQVIEGEEADDGPGIMRDHVAAAARRRTGEDAPDKPVVWTDLPREEGHGALARAGAQMPAPTPAAVNGAHRVALNFSPEAWAMMEANRVADNFASVEDFIRASVRGTVNAYCESLDSDSEELRTMFARPAAE